MARKQVEAGADMLDVNFGIESTVSPQFMEKVILHLAYELGVPLSLDVQTPELLARLMRIYPGRPLVNSSRVLESELRQKLSYLEKYGGILLVLCMERDVPKNFEERKKNIENGLGTIAGMKMENRVIFDPIVLSMGAGNDPAAVLDEELRVTGVDNLRVCDAAAMPTQITGNPNATVIAMAEKAADMILQRQSLPPEDPRKTV